jgi:hypothetical protein
MSDVHVYVPNRQPILSNDTVENFSISRFQFFIPANVSPMESVTRRYVEKLQNL